MQKYPYLPQSHTHFIIPLIPEQLRIFPLFFLIFLFPFVLIKRFYIPTKSDDPFPTLLPIPISTIIPIHSFINLPPLTALIPITRLTLP
ncbi:FtsW/RodA/SpoVE family cell cycle protein, partial [Bacillus subtilis]|uniref:FtsW/RodA/SpoVE family cell cycle protein n=1 Tax=Bacillus subtilis TaxID=1423 RepID=UPI00338E8A97